MSEAQQCRNCGAMMAPDEHGRLYACAYCGTQVQVGIAGEQIAAGLAADLSNIDSFLHRLAATLHEGFAEHAHVEAQGQHVVAIEVRLDPDHFHVRRDGRHAVATHKKIVRGIALRTKTLALDVWFAELTRALAAHANSNARAAWVLSRIGGG